MPVERASTGRCPGLLAGAPDRLGTTLATIDPKWPCLT